MYSCSYDQTVKIRDKDNIQKTTESLNINLGKIYSMFFDIDFKVLIISGEKGTEFWNQNNDNYVIDILNTRIKINDKYYYPKTYEFC